MREIAVLTTSRADFGIYEPVLRAMRGRLRPRILATGSHVEPGFGNTIREIGEAGHEVFRKFRCLAAGIPESISRAVSGMDRILRSWRPDLLLVLGDRFEMLAGALAALPHHVPIAHLHGGEVTTGALDDSFRHALTKISHLHFVATADSGARLVRMGEERWRIVVSGAPALDRLRDFRPEPVDLPGGFLLVTYHPVTLEPGEEQSQVEALIRALRRIGRPCVVTAPNADPGREIIRERLREFCRRDGHSRFVESAGAATYFTLMSRAAAMVGNSSSGILEAASFLLPVVNVGSRQAGRLRARNVIDCGNPADEIRRAVKRALDPSFRRSLARLRNPYGDGRAGARIARRLETIPLDDRLLRKRFCDR